MLSKQDGGRQSDISHRVHTVHSELTRWNGNKCVAQWKNSCKETGVYIHHIIQMHAI